MNAFGVLIQLGAAGSAPDRFHLGHLNKKLFCEQAEAVRLGQRNPGIVLQRKDERAFVEWRQEASRQLRGGIAGNDNGDGYRPDDNPTMSECPIKQDPVRMLEISYDKIV